MVYLVRLFTISSAILTTANVVTAGPINWGYKAVDPVGNVLRNVSGLTVANYADAFLPDPQVSGQFTSTASSSDHRLDVWRSEATVTITDAASGVSGSVAVHRDYTKEYDLSNGVWELIWEGEGGGPWPTPVELVLGQNNYEVKAPGGELMVTVSPVGVPEPATLGLVGVGLGVVGLARRRCG